LASLVQSARGPQSQAEAPQGSSEDEEAYVNVSWDDLIEAVRAEPEQMPGRKVRALSVLGLLRSEGMAPDCVLHERSMRYVRGYGTVTREVILRVANRLFGCGKPPVPQELPTCSGCRFWRRIGLVSGRETLGEAGACRRRSPVNVSPTFQGRTWPTTWCEDWCGDHDPTVPTVPTMERVAEDAK
jgi:hypothetical protein